MEGFRMANTAAQAYYATSYAFNNSTTSTITLIVWQQLSLHLENFQLPMSAEELGKATGLTQEQLDRMFGQEYYQKYYGFRRFNSLEAWREWAESTGVLYVPALHDPQPAEHAAAEPEDDEAEGAEA
jgi:hypothetical protein